MTVCRKFSFFLPIKPMATQRSRCGCRGKFPNAYTDPRYREWKDEAIRLLQGIPTPSGVDLEGDVSVGVEVIVGRPKTTKRYRPRGDRDNFEKGLFDAITQAGGWWKDDDQIVSGPFEKRWALPTESPGYVVTVEYL